MEEKLKNKKNFSKILIASKIASFYVSLLLILLSTVLIANFFIGDEIFAQMMDPNDPSTWNEVHVYLYYPPPEQTPIIYGQTDFIFNFTGIEPEIFGQHITDFVIEVYNDPAASSTSYLGNFNILDYFQHNQSGTTDTFWTFRVDTMDFENFQYYFRIRAWADDFEIPLIYQSGLNNVMGPFKIQNIPEILQPQHNSEVAGDSVNLVAKLNGQAEQVWFNIKDTSSNIVDSYIVTSPDNGSDPITYWSTFWDTTRLQNNSYLVTLSFKTLVGNEMTDVYELPVIINNDQSVPEDCSDPQWQCESWPECPSTGTRSRICTTINCNPNYSETFNENCSFSPPDDPNTNINNNTTPPPLADGTVDPANNDSTAPPIITPKIEMRYPAQGDVVSGDIVLKAVADVSIYRLEFLYMNKVINIEEFIGQANKSLNNNLLWQRTWGTDEIPSGQYKVFARATMADGHKYLSNYIIVTINHENYEVDNNTIEEVIPHTDDSTTDSDGDGLDDNTEQNIGTDPNDPNIIEDYTELVDKAVVDGKITTDRATKLKTGFIIDQPKNSRLQPSHDIKVLKIENISPKIGKNNLVISGTGPAKTTIKLYIYSDPIVVTTKTDDSGNFTYILDKDLLDGEHEVYVTINDETGKITKQSSPLSFFVRRAQAVTEEEYLRGDVNIVSESSSVVNKYVIPAVITVVALILVFIGIFMLKRKDNEIR